MGAAGPGQSDRAAGGCSGDPLGTLTGLRLEVLVDLGHVLHHALPVGPVGVEHLTELLRVERKRSRGGTTDHLPQRGSDPGPVGAA